MKVLLINPPLKYLISANVPSFVEEERGTYPPIGLLYIAAYLKKYGPKNLQLKVIDTVLENMDYSDIANLIAKENPDIVSTQILTFTLIDSLKIVQLVKKINPQIITVVGGRHCDIYPTETIRFKFIDYLIQGEGEITFLELVKNLNRPENLQNLAGLTFKTKNGIINNPPRLIENLDQLPFPARELTPYKKYRFLLAKNSVFTTLITSRGCPYSCTFCDEGRKKFRALSARRIVDEILECKNNFGIDTFFIFDSTFTINRQRVLDFCDELIKRKLNIIFDIRSRVNLIDEEMLKKLKQAGCVRIQYGVESGNDKVLKKINKLITAEQTKKVIKITHKYNFEILCDFMFGLPGEREEEIMDTINLSIELPIDYAHYAITTPYPNTALYFQGIKKGMFNDYWREFSLHPHLNFEPPVWEENFTRDELINYLAIAYRKFYRRPQYLWQQIWKIKTPGEFLRKAKAGLKVLIRN